VSGRSRIGAVHALAGSIEPTGRAFERVWPEADVAHLLDGALYLDRSRGTASEAEIRRRIDRLIRHAHETGAEGIVFTGSFFGAAVRQARPHVPVPVLTSFDGIVATALGRAEPLHVLSTAPDSVRLLAGELRAQATARGLEITLTTGIVPGAMEALVAGDLAAHDGRVLDAVRSEDPTVAIVLAQFSMERVLEAANRTREGAVLGPATEGAALLRERVGDP